MKEGIIGLFNQRFLAEQKMQELAYLYDIDIDDFRIDWDAGARRWILTYEP